MVVAELDFLFHGPWTKVREKLSCTLITHVQDRF